MLCWSSGGWCAGRSHLLTGVTVLIAVYHFGTKRTEHWLWVAPGARGRDVSVVPHDAGFGWYVTRVADYSMFYGCVLAQALQAGLALHHRVQCAGGGGVERGSLSRSDRKTDDRPDVFRSAGRLEFFKTVTAHSQHRRQATTDTQADRKLHVHKGRSSHTDSLSG